VQLAAALVIGVITGVTITYAVYSGSKNRAVPDPGMVTGQSTSTGTVVLSSVATLPDVAIDREMLGDIIAQTAQETAQETAQAMLAQFKDSFQPAAQHDDGSTSATQPGGSPVATPAQQDTFATLSSRVREPGFFYDGMTIHDLSSSEEMQSLPEKLQFEIISGVMGMLNRGELTRSQVFGPGLAAR